ncbi:MAG: DUF373 family protein [Candidatus Diapherotrites archaeon]
MAKETKSVLVLSVDRDNDLGRKTGIEGPVIGRKAVLNAAAKLAVSDPTESDANCMFAAVKKFDEAKGEFANVEVAALTGVDKSGFKSDKRINEQLDHLLDSFPADGFVLVTDGAEDDQVIPILQSRAKIISKETIIIKQAKEIESTYFTIKSALKDPLLSTMFFVIPGIIMLLVAVLPNLGFQIVLGGIGIFFLVYGLGIYDRLIDLAQTFARPISLQRTSFIFYVATLILLVFGAIQAYSTYGSVLAEESDQLIAAGEAFAQLVAFFALSGISFLLGRAIDSIHLKKAFRLRRYLLSSVFAVLIWFIVEAAKYVIIGVPKAGAIEREKGDLFFFLISIGFSFAVAMLAYWVSNLLDVRKKVTKLLIGLPVYSKEGRWIGKVENVKTKEEVIEFKENKTKQVKPLKKKQFVLHDERITLVSG